MTINRRLLLTLTPVILFVFATLTFFAQGKISTLSSLSADETAMLNLKDEAPVVFEILNTAVADTRTLGEILLTVQAADAPDRELMGRILKGFLEKNLMYQGVWVVWEPQAFDKRDSDFMGHAYSANDGSLAMYWYQGASGKVEVTGVNVRNETFYTIPKQKRVLTLIEPYIDPAAQPPVLMTTVTLPLVRDNKVLGVFGIDIALDKLSTLIEAIRPYKTGYAMLFTDKGYVLASPKRDQVGKMMQELEPALYEKLDKALQTGTPLQETVTLNDTRWRVIVEPVVLLPGAPAWSLVAFVPEEIAMAEATSALQTLLIIGLVGILVIVGIIIFAANMVGAPLGRLSAYATAVSGGDYSVQLDQSKFKDETAVLGNAITRMVQDLVKKIGEATHISQQAHQKSEEAAQATELARQAQGKAESARREGMLQAAAQLENIVLVISSASDELAAQIAQSERGATEQAARATRTFSSMDAMSSTVATVALNAGATSDAAAQTRQKAEAGASVVREVLTGIEQVQRNSLTLKADMAQLSDHAQAISQIMSVISDIADQTNLLALNAAIEAARAGDAGRGFAVVADEVRKLAEKTMSSTTQVGSAIKAIQDSATQSARQVDATVQNIEATTVLATRSGDALKEIVQMVDTAAVQMQRIAAEAERQSATSEEINRSLEQVNTIANETVITMGEASRAVADLTGQARELSSLIHDMKS